MPVIAFLASCGGGNKTVVEKAEESEGEKLAKIYCVSCHVYTEPSLLDRKTWVTSVLPVMAGNMGFDSLNGKPCPSAKNDPDCPKGYYPEKPTISLADFEKIVEFYSANSPAEMPGQQRDINPGEDVGLFVAKQPTTYQVSGPMATYVNIDEKNKLIHIGQSSAEQFGENALFSFGTDLTDFTKVKTPSGPTWIDFNSNQPVLCCIGSVFPSNKKEGSVSTLVFNADGKITGLGKTLASNLARSVQALHKDMDGNGTNDLVIGQFGYLRGELTFMKDAKSASSRMLREAPGPIMSYEIDWDGNGLLDIVTLMAQGKEGIYAFLNKGNGQFEEKALMQFIPVNGSSFFELVDFNKDNKLDILYTCGDNADYSAVLKPYHGVYIYINEGSSFKQQWFYPVNGCYKALARDFDLDGDLDIASISFFADYKNQQFEDLLYYENTGNFSFKPSRIKGFDAGRWLTMDAGDADGDGDADIVVGNFSLGPGFGISQEQQKKWMEGPLFLYLENTKK